MARSCNHYNRIKTIISTCSECVSVALVTQHAIRMRRIVIFGLSGSNIFSTLFHKRQDLGREVLKFKMCAF